mmetsp:Transcript_9667/g.17589  ORF Transcript_9667/g.17589 Transcript_9667/m.17589 type:complete len:156 (+) Transcript_9667:29-496(+)
MHHHGIPGEIHERPWVNFGVNRQQALELAVQLVSKQSRLAALFIDADDEFVVSDPFFYKTLRPDISYSVEIRFRSVNLYRLALVNICITLWEWSWPVHEAISRLGGADAVERLESAWIQPYIQQLAWRMITGGVMGIEVHEGCCHVGGLRGPTSG